MKQENTYKLPSGLQLSCLCGIHSKDSKCQVYLRNNGKINEANDLMQKELVQLEIWAKSALSINTTQNF